MADKPSWGVVATAFEAPDATLFFAAYHLALGAKTVSVYFDDPEDAAAERLRALPGCKVVICNDNYWQGPKRNGRPANHTTRQRRNATHAYRRTTCDWLFHIDIDELIYPFRSLADELATLPDDLEALRIPPLERIAHREEIPTTIYDGSFRRQLKEPKDLHLFGTPGLLARTCRQVRGPRLRRRLYGDMEAVIRTGFSGYATGKSATRKGGDLVISNHRPIKWSDRAYQARTVWSRSAALLHFEGLTPLQWVFKRLRAIEKVRLNPELTFNHAMREQVPWMQRGDPAQVAFEMYRRLCTTDQAGRDLMRRHELLADVTLDLSAPLALTGALDLSPAAVDDWLWQQHGDVLARYGLEP